MKAKHCVFVGRFQPFHNGHLRVALQGLKEAENLIIVVGSHRAPRTIRNPWDFETRKKLIMDSLPEDKRGNVTIVPLRDFVYNDLAWVTALQNVIRQVTGSNETVKLIGCYKDDGNYYLKLFPQWQLVRENYHDNLDARKVREVLFTRQPVFSSLVPEPVSEFLYEYMKTPEFGELAAEHRFIQDYRAKWASAPFPPVFVTTDAVVVKAGHVLLIKRGMNPGKGKLALPGGFVGPKETIFDSALRELKEETSIIIPRDVLVGSLSKEKVFDHPNRDNRGRTITHAFYFHLEAGGELPVVNGGDDASEAIWVPLGELALLEENFYSDHLHIINYFVSNV